MSLPRLWLSSQFPGTFLHINALADTQRYQIYASHPAARTPYLQEDAFLTRQDIIRFQEPHFDKDKDYANWCLSYCQEHNISIFIPGRAREHFASAVFQRAFQEAGIHVMVAASAYTLRLLNNKIRFLEAIKDLNIPIAPWKPFTTVESFNQAWQALGSGKKVALCVKPAVGIYGNGFWRISRHKSYLHNYERLMIDVTSFKQRLGQKVRKPWLLMAYCEGAERSVDCIAYRGKLVAALVRRKEKHKQVIEKHPALLEYAKKLIARFKLSGIINIQFKDHQGQPCILEINARASAGSVMAYQAGLNIMPLAIEAMQNEGNISIPPIKIGLGISRTHYYYTLPDYPEDERAFNECSN